MHEGEDASPVLILSCFAQSKKLQDSVKELSQDLREATKENGVLKASSDPSPPPRFFPVLCV